MDFLARLFGSDEFMPHGHCYYWRPDILWLHTVSDVLIALAYYSIPLLLVYFVRKRRDLAFKRIFLMFGAFILACGTTHVMSVWTTWNPSYGAEGVIKSLTAAISIVTGIMMIPLVPQALRLPSPAQLAAVNDTLRQREHTLQEKNEELQRALQAKDRFLASMSHELRTPLNAVIGFTGTLLMKLPGPLNTEQEAQLRTVQTSARHLLSLINDLLDLARVDSGKVELHLDALVCQEVVGQVATVLRPMADEKRLAFEVEVPPEDVVIRSDRRSLNQILLNLAGNAVKFTQEGGVRISLRRVPANGDEPASVDITVADSGRGIRREDVDRLFKAFSRISREDEPPREGTGLGLYLSQRLAGLLGGRISFVSEPGRGSAFTLRLPA